ncbi:unnamed protein product [Rotaria socialis]|uniref:mitogen-activated protein kinase kinase n=1 Tax=Rotaria socialis TaxID=392032 RepID=A0A818LFW0_9BILA|nr:unnamed protein product [Rotaria socialis]CAF3337272.1 unnamed protein product [Rotaria socialis]CAF3423690.1 unnamed protein product [Rotaria socialis]CAF3577441.1 unnamed protein product [Rotaria socialis]CAF3766114.1 unnamed protein product [Rotaria socialis]
MATPRTANSARKALAKKNALGNFTITCPHLTDEKKISATYTLEVPSGMTTLTYHEQIIEVTTKQFDTLRVLGRGCYGTVLAVTIEGHPDVEMAVKKIALETQEERRASTYTDLTTIQNVGSHNYPYIISYYGAVIDKESSELLICVELMNASMERFYQAMHAHNVSPTDFDQILCRLTHNITSALHFLKTRRILHRDVKPQNMLVNKQAVFKLCDFGISRQMRVSQSIADGAVQGTEAYMPPELIGDVGQTYGIRADMWALGLSLFEIVNGKQPFAGMTAFQTMMAIRAWAPTIPSNPKISNDMKCLITYLLKRNVDERPKTYLEILEIPSIQNVTEHPSDEEIKFVTYILDNLPPLTEF